MASAKNLFCALVLTAVCAASAVAAELADKPKEDAKLAARLKLLRQVGERVQVSVKTGEKSLPIKMLAEPLYRYREESRHYADAVVWAWGDGGRPKAILTLACHIEPNTKMLTYEFDSLSANPLICTIDGQERWSPRGPGTEMKLLDGALKPADDKAGRRRQIDALLARLKATEVGDVPGVDQASQQKTIDLPWTAKPVYFYSDPDQGIIEGAICFACIETNPEVLLVLETQRRPNSPPSWYYGFNRVAFAELHVQLDDKEIWTAPRLGSTTSDDSYHLIPVMMGR